VTAVVLPSAIVRAPTHLFAVLLALPLLAGCGGGSAATTTPTSTAPRAPALATRPSATGEIVVRGEASPEARGPYVFDGRYLVRFEQYAPEDAALDFTAQTPFSVSLTPRRDDPRGAIKLVEAAAATGRKDAQLHGRYFVSVDFGDFPYVIRFTPRGA
jgi:hypothetical protein